ncbi:MAG: hypothetical protein U0T68_01275 [Ferruginibacter sp.]
MPFRILIILLLFSFNSFGQHDSSKIFKKSKGLLTPPFKNTDNFAIELDDNREKPPCNCISYISDSSLTAIAVYDGWVESVKPIEDDYYILITRYGEYHIVYSGIIKPEFSEKTFIRKGQKLSKLATGFDNYKLDIYIYRKSKALKTSSWFKK